MGGAGLNSAQCSPPPLVITRRESKDVEDTLRGEGDLQI